jgi:hypothetical protein
LKFGVLAVAALKCVVAVADYRATLAAMLRKQLE